jgi:putative colanic acid biosysnthesis UDP-glucose lipid carrier transferase
MLPKGLLKEYSHALALLMRLLDMCAILVAGLLAYVYRFPDYPVTRSYLMAIIIGTLSVPLIFSFFQIYTSVRGKGLMNHFFTLIQAVFVMTLMLAGLAFFTKSGEVYSRLWFMQWMLLSVGCLILLRCSLLLFLRFMRSHGLNERRVVIFGAGKLGRKLADTVQQALWTGFRITSFIDDHAAQKELSRTPIPVIQTPSHLSNYLKDHGIDEIWIALPLRAEERVKAILHELRHHTITTRFVLDIFGLDLLNHSIADLAGFPVLNIRSTPMMGINRLIKAFEDRMMAAIILLIISPLLVLIALGIKCTSRGPVLFKQLRNGWDGKVIKVYKFRTMFLHEEKIGQVTQASMNDKRVTPFGRFLRRTSLDELPQFINVLQGRMSIVGPRPHAIQHNEYYKDSIDTYMQRHRVKPGITGWAQVNGWRGETDTLEKMQKRVEYDLFYINNWSLGFDLKIIFLTFFRGFINPNAY